MTWWTAGASLASFACDYIPGGAFISVPIDAALAIFFLSAGLYATGIVRLFTLIADFVPVPGLKTAAKQFGQAAGQAVEFGLTPQALFSRLFGSFTGLLEAFLAVLCVARLAYKIGTGKISHVEWEDMKRHIGDFWHKGSPWAAKDAAWKAVKWAALPASWGGGGGGSGGKRGSKAGPDGDAGEGAKGDVSPPAAPAGDAGEGAKAAAPPTGGKVQREHDE